jgi:DNA-binding Lrp family transcriptional regulator
MPRMYVLVITRPGKDEDVLADILKVKHVREANMVYGVSNIVAKIEADSADELRRAYDWEFSKIDGIVHKYGLVSMDGLYFSKS